MEDMDPGYHGTGDVDAMRQSQRDKLLGVMETLVNKTTARNIEPAKEEVRKVAKCKPKMQQKSFYLCDVCGIVIAKPEDGYIVHGNVYIADTSCRGGIIGNNFPEVKPGDSIKVEDVQETVFCKKCFLKALGIAVVEVEESAIGKLKKMAEGVNITQPDRTPRRNAYRPQNTSNGPPPRSAPQHGYGSYDPGIEARGYDNIDERMDAVPESSAVGRDNYPRIHETDGADEAMPQPDGWRDDMPSEGRRNEGVLARDARIAQQILAQQRSATEQGPFNNRNFRGILNG